MAAEHVLAVDLAKIWRTPTRRGFVRTIGWGDRLEVLATTAEHVEVRIWDFARQPDGSERPVASSGYIAPPRAERRILADLVVPAAERNTLKVDFVDVQQGDGTVIESPRGRVLLVDGGDNQLYARYLAGRFRRTSPTDPLVPEAIVVTHGDADHYGGLAEIEASEGHTTSWKRLFLAPKRVFHNGLVKRPDKLPSGRRRPELQMLGAVQKVGPDRIITGLVDEIRDLDDDQLNAPFRLWKRALQRWGLRRPLEVKRIRRGDGAFDFLADESIDVEVLGPIETTRQGVQGLRFLGSPPPGPRVESDAGIARRSFTGTSASHTINGHSIILRLRYNNVRILLTGDLNGEAASALLAASPGDDSPVRSEVFKVPHHGSADFDPRFIAAVSPVVSVVSSGDENARKEYIHPRATVMGALGRYSRIDEPLIFVTELVAFFESEGWVDPEMHQVDRDGIAIVRDGATAVLPKAKRKPSFFSFSRRAFGIVRVRTDGRRLLVYTDSGHADLKEAYAFEVDARGTVTPSGVVQV